MNKIDVYKKAIENGRRGRPIVLNFLPLAIKASINNLAEDGFLGIYDSYVDKYSYAFIPNVYCVILDKNEPDAENYIKRYLGELSHEHPPFNFYPNAEEIFQKWLIDSEGSYKQWKEVNRELLENMMNLDNISDDEIGDIANFSDNYKEYIKSQDWYIENPTVSNVKAIIDEKLSIIEEGTLEYRYIVKFAKLLANVGENAYIQAIFN